MKLPLYAVPEIDEVARELSANSRHGLSLSGVCSRSQCFEQGAFADQH
jgi:hypothetical protein